MTETETHETAEPATHAVTEPMTEPTSGPIAGELHKDEDRLGHAKNSLIHAVESAVGKVTDTLGISGGRK
jgi:hypothetical protein